jgi:formylglycine-generating enzyme required for sulfatase activity
LKLWVRAVFAITLLLWPTALHAAAEKRIALLIGNKDYKAGVGPLTNPLNDIRIVGEALKGVGFEVLKPVENAQRSAMLIAIHAFAAKLKAAGPDAVGFLYYSGHGIASAGENYLIPTDIDQPSTVLLSVQGVKQSEVLAILRSEAPNAAHYLVLDACRHALQGARGGKGFVPVGQQSGVLVAFAAEPGKTASDIGQGSGPYAAALATELVKPAQNDLLMFHNVRVAVMDKTNGDQVPWTEDGIQRRQRIQFGEVAKATPPPTAPPVRVSPSEFFGRVEDDLFTTPAERGHAILKQQGTTPWMLTCESSDRTWCELSIFCTWANNRCEKKSGSLATAMLEASPPSKPALAPAAPCVETLVGSEKRCLKPGDSFKDCPDCPEMVVVPAGKFRMGSPPDEEGRDENEGPQRDVTITNPFAVGKFEATFAEWDACVAADGCKRKPRDLNLRDKQPVINVSWDNITKEYLPWLNRMTGKSYRLLTEAEWEYVARAGTTTRFTTGTMISSTRHANFDGRAEFGGGLKGPNRDTTVEVGSFQPNGFGLHDIHGNVREWVQDCFHSYAGAPTDGRAAADGAECWRINRGGNWFNAAFRLRSATRHSLPQDRYDIYTGFRLARTLNP